MTDAMWFAWLLRTDVRGGADVGDPEGQREFVAWWLLFARREYPAVWSCGPDQVVIAMEPVPTLTGGTLPRLLRRLLAARPDLVAAFPPDSEDNLVDLLCWYRLSGADELDAAPPLCANDLARTERAERRPPWGEGPPLPRIAVALHTRRADLQALFPPDDPVARRRFAEWYHRAGTHLLPQTSPRRSGGAPAAPHVLGACSGQPLGVNLVGFATSEFGLGEDARMAAAALEAARVPFTVLDIPPLGSSVRRHDTTLADKLSQRLVHPVTLLCLTAFDTAALYLDRGSDFFAASHTIGWWPWELPRFPAAWTPAFALVDEVWAPSRYTQAAYAAAGAPAPRWMPPAVEVPRQPALRRAELGLPDNRFLFIYPFDPNSYLARKNPIAVVQAFQHAFAQTDLAVGLVLRVNGNLPTTGAGGALQRAAAADPRIRLDEGTLDRGRALATLAACDCLVSLHRAEGLGRNIAEAILLGVQVIATGFSGCVDFLEPDECVAWHPRVVTDGEYPFGEGQHWAEPDLTAAAAAMQRAVERSHHPRDLHRSLMRRATRLQRGYSPQVVGERLRRAIVALADNGGS